MVVISNLAGSRVANSLREKFVAWWHGYDMDGLEEGLLGPISAPATGEREIAQPSGKGEWTVERVGAVQTVFGAGADSPLAFARVAELIKPLGMNEQMSVLEIGSGLGVGLRVVAQEAGAWIDGIEYNPSLVEESNRLISGDGLQKKAVPTSQHIDSELIRKRRRDVVISRDALHQFPERDDLLQSILAVIKPSGQFLYTDFMVDFDARQDAVQDWCEMHPALPTLRSLDQARQELIDLGFDVRVARDETAEYIAHVLAALKEFAGGLKNKPVGVEMRDWVIWEVEYWARTVAALESGGLRHCRIHAVSPIEEEL